METFQSLLNRELSRALTAAGLPATGEVVPATDPRFGDYQTNAALVLAKQRGENPRAARAENHRAPRRRRMVRITDDRRRRFHQSRAQARGRRGAGRAAFAGRSAGRPSPTHGARIVIDFGSPNVAKPMHVGHIRSTVLGDALARIAEFLGHEVIRDNHIGDWGTQFGMVIYGWKNLLDRAALRAATRSRSWFGFTRRRTSSRTADPAVRDACRNELVRLQAGDQENLAHLE